MSADDITRITIFTGEYSGNLFGAKIAGNIRALAAGREVHLSGTGCSEMKEAGVELLFDCSDWGGIGLIEALKRFKRLWLAFRNIRRLLTESPPDAILLIDYPGFNMAIVRVAHELGIPTVYYFPPGKFARTVEEIEEAARLTTVVAAPFPTTYRMYKEAGANVVLAGHPAGDMLPKIDGGEARSLLLEEAGMSLREPIPPDAGTAVIGMLPGSRRKEIETHFPVMLDAARRMQAELVRGGTVPLFVVPLPRVAPEDVKRRVEETAERSRSQEGIRVYVTEGKAYETMAASDVLIVSSGTATLEAMCYGTPMVIVYKASWITEWIAKRFFYSRLPEFFGLPNLIAGEKVVPELLQADFQSSKIAAEAMELLLMEAKRRHMIATLSRLASMVAKPGACRKVASLVMELALEGREGRGRQDARGRSAANR